MKDSLHIFSHFPRVDFSASVRFLALIILFSPAVSFAQDAFNDTDDPESAFDVSWHPAFRGAHLDFATLVFLAHTEAAIDVDFLRLKMLLPLAVGLQGGVDQYGWWTTEESHKYLDYHFLSRLTLPLPADAKGRWGSIDFYAGGAFHHKYDYSSNRFHYQGFMPKYAAEIRGMILPPVLAFLIHTSGTPMPEPAQWASASQSDIFNEN